MDKRKFLKSGAGLLTGVSFANVAQVGVTNAVYESERDAALKNAIYFSDIMRAEDWFVQMEEDIGLLINKAYNILNEGNNSTGNELNNILNDSNSLNQKKVLALAVLNAFVDMDYYSGEEEFEGPAPDFRLGGSKEEWERFVNEYRRDAKFVNLINMLIKILDSDKPLDYCKSALDHGNLLCKDKEQIIDQEQITKGLGKDYDMFYDKDCDDPDVIYVYACVQLEHKDLLKHIIRFFERMEKEHLSDKALRMFLEALLKFSVERSLYRYGVRYGATYYKREGISSGYGDINDFYKDKIETLSKSLYAAKAAPKKLPLGNLGKIGSYLQCNWFNNERRALHTYMAENEIKVLRPYEQID